MFQLKIRISAKEDVQKIVDYYDGISRKITDRFLLVFYKELDYIIQNPDSFQVKYRNTRVVYIKGFPFGIHYRITQKTIIEVLAVLHTSMHPKYG